MSERFVRSHSGSSSSSSSSSSSISSSSSDIPISLAGASLVASVVTHRVRILRMLFVTVCCTLPGTAGDAAANEMKQHDDRPNILFIFADDWGRYASAFGKLEPGTVNDVVSTPNFDTLASRGVLFTNAFVNAPSCTPCRSSLLSGQHFWRTGRGAILQGAVWDDRIPVFPLLLQSSGYSIGHTAKVWSPGTPANAPFGGAKTAFNSAGNRFNQFSQAVDAAADRSLTRSQLLTEVRLNFRTFLEKRESGKPFCYWWGPTNTHRTWIRGSGKNHWGLNPDDLKGKMNRHLPDVPEVREDFADYLGEVQAFDAGLGALLEELKISGESDRTLIVVSGDHGIPGMPAGKCNLYDLGTRVPLLIVRPGEIQRGRVVEDFVSLPDLAPTLLEAANVVIPKSMTGGSLMSQLNSDRDGIIDPSRSFVVFGRERHVAAARDGFRPYPQRAIRTAEYLYIRNYEPERWPMGTAPGYGLPDGELPDFENLMTNTFAAFADMDAGPTKAWLITESVRNPQLRHYFDAAFARRPAEEFYDLRADPDQIRNVASVSGYQIQKDLLAQKLNTILSATQDPRVTSSPVQFELSPYSDEVSPQQNPKRKQ